MRGLRALARYNGGMIYYVEDDTNIRDLAVYALKQAGLEARGFASARDFFAACRQVPPDLILLDIMLPEVDGMEILRRVREDEALGTLPVMMLTAKGTEYDKVCGLDAGADDYLAKPFGMMELVSRVNALLRRAQMQGQTLGRGRNQGQGQGQAAPGRDVLVAGPIELAPSAHTVTVAGQQVALTLKEFDLLRALMQHRGCVLTRAQLLEDVWGITYVGETRTVDVHIQTLRQKLARAEEGADALITTVRGVGYRMKAAD